MKNNFIKVLVILVVQAVVVGSVALNAANTYTATWSSVNQHNPAPEWFQDAKFGIYYHWGVYSVPAYANEWYPRNMYNRGSNENNHHNSTYGDPYGNWPYHNFINGANDRSGRWTQFAPKLKSAGGNFDPDEWAQLFSDAGAKFAGPASEHHDGFSMWDSDVNEWNSVDRGPRLDLAGLFATAIRAKGMKFFVSSHNAYNFTGYYSFVGSQSDQSLRKLYGQLGSTAEQQLWVDKLKELIDKYQPDIMWHDFNLGQISESQRLNYLSYYYNKAIDWGKEVVVTYKDGFQRGEVYDYERGGPANIRTPYWLTDDSISSSSWCYTNGIGYYSMRAILHSLIDRVSKGGNMVLNIAPMWDGTIPQGQRDILIGIGNWLKKYGEAIYSTRTYSSFGEGPTSMGGGSFQQPRAGTSTDYRFTRNKANDVIYVTGLGWPSNNQAVITSFRSGSFDASRITAVTFLNGEGSCTYSQDGTGLRVNLPSNLSDNNGYAIKIYLGGSPTTPEPTETPGPTPTPNLEPIFSGGPYTLDGTTGYDLPDGLTNDLYDFSIACRVNLNSLDTWTRIYDFGGDTNIFMMLTPASGNTGYPYFCITLSGNPGEQGLDGTSALPTMSWQHIAVTRSGSTGILYINGQEVDRNTGMTINPRDMGNTLNNYIGRSQWSHDPYLNGQVDEFFVYNRAISAAEVEALAGSQEITPEPTETPTSTPAPTSTPPPGDCNVSFDPENSTQSLNSMFPVNVIVDSGNQVLAAYGFTITYNASVLRVEGVEAGADGFLAAVNTATPGEIIASGFDASGTGPGENLQVVTVTYTAIAEGTSILGLFVDRLVDGDTNTIGTACGNGGSVEVTTAMPGDTNGDGAIDIIDALLTAQHYVGLDPANFMPGNADVNCDGAIDIIDALLIAQYYVGLINGFC